MKMVWKQAGRHIDIIIMALTSLCIGVTAWANVNSKLSEHEKHLAVVDAVQIMQGQKIDTIQQTAARTEQKVDDMAGNIQEIKSWIRKK